MWETIESLLKAALFAYFESKYPANTKAQVPSKPFVCQYMGVVFEQNAMETLRCVE